jgi:hypothetical protein
MPAKHNLRGLVAHYGGTLSVRPFSGAAGRRPASRLGTLRRSDTLWPLTQVFQPPLRVAIPDPPQFPG